MGHVPHSKQATQEESQISLGTIPWLFRHCRFTICSGITACKTNRMNVARKFWHSLYYWKRNSIREKRQTPKQRKRCLRCLSGKMNKLLFLIWGIQEQNFRKGTAIRAFPAVFTPRSCRQSGHFKWKISLCYPNPNSLGKSCSIPISGAPRIIFLRKAEPCFLLWHPNNFYFKNAQGGGR